MKCFVVPLVLSFQLLASGWHTGVAADDADAPELRLGSMPAPFSLRPAPHPRGTAGAQQSISAIVHTDPASAVLQSSTQRRLLFVGPLAAVEQLASKVKVFIGGLFGISVDVQQQNPPAAPAAAPPTAEQPAETPAVPEPEAPAVPAPTTAAVPKPQTPTPPAAAVPKPSVKPADTVTMCDWRPDFNSCVIGRKYLLAINAVPNSYASKLALAAAARDQACSAYTTADDCLKKSSADLLCNWEMGGSVGWDKGCHSQYMSEWTTFTLQGDKQGPLKAAQALSHVGSLTCPGTLAQQTLRCSEIYPMNSAGEWAPNKCQEGVGCTYLDDPHSCVTSPSMQALVSKLEPRVVGTCSAVCYLRMLSKCADNSQRRSSERESWCNGQPGCRWDGGGCRADVLTSGLDNWGPQAREASDTCARQKGERECAAAGSKGAKVVVFGRAQQFVGWPIDQGLADARCLV